jgi:hypothetical protein
MRTKLELAGLVLLLGAIPVAAHHNFAAAYDSSATITLTGVVTKIDWTNSHAYIYLDVKDESGKVVNWGMEGYPPNTLKRTGFSRDIVKVGDTITITGYRARENTNCAAAREVTVADGAKYNFGSLPPPPNMDWSFVALLH